MEDGYIVAIVSMICCTVVTIIAILVVAKNFLKAKVKDKNREVSVGFAPPKQKVKIIESQRVDKEKRKYKKKATTKKR